MISTQKLLFDIDTKLNKLSSLEGQFIPDETKIDVANRMQIKLILKKFGLNNNYQLGFDSFKKRYQDLEILIVPHEKVSVTKVPDDVFNSYSSDLSTLSKPYFLPIDAYLLATRGNCKSRVLDVIELVKHGDLQVKLKSPHWTPSFEYQESLGMISNNTFYSYPDTKNTFTIDSLNLSYMRYPLDMDVAGYIHLDGTPSTDVDCELDSYLEDDLVDLIVAELADATGNQEQSQLSRVRQKENE